MLNICLGVSALLPVKTGVFVAFTMTKSGISMKLMKMMILGVVSHATPQSGSL